MSSREPKPAEAPTDRRDAGRAPDDVVALRARLALTERKLAELERDYALALTRERQMRDESQHRVRNLLAILRSIFARTVGSGQSIEDFSHHFRGRLDTLARFHAPRSVAPGRMIDLEELIREDLKNFEFDERVRVEGQELRLPHDIAQLLGLAVHELAANSIKFGTLSSFDPGARLDVTWSCADGALVLLWKESGISIVAPAPLPRGFGREFIEHALPYQLEAETRFELKPGGLECAITVPLPDGAGKTVPIRRWI